MIYSVEISFNATENIERHIKAGNKKLVNKIVAMIEELKLNPRSGTGKPEQLKGYVAERWSRRIDIKHRLVYEIHEEELLVIAISAYGHYGDR